MRYLLLILCFICSIPANGSKQKSKSLEQQIDSLNELSWRLKQSDLSAAQELAVTAEYLSKENNYTKGLIFATKNLAALYIFRANYDSALLKSNIFLSLSQEQEDSTEISNAYNLLGGIYYYKGAFEVSIENYLKALAIKERLQDLSGTAKLYNNISALYIGQKKYKKSIEFNLRSIEIKKRLEDSIGLASSYNNIGFAYRKIQHYDTALYYSKKGLKIIEKTQDKILTASLLANTGEIYLYRNQLDSALISYLRSIELTEEQEEKRTRIYGYLGVGKVYLTQEKYSKALPYLESGNEMALDIKAHQEIMDSYNALSKAYAKKGDYSKAYQSHVQFSIYKDSLQNESNNNIIEELEQKYESDKQQATIRLLELENQLQETIFNRQRAVGIILILALIVMGWLAISLFKNNRSKKMAIEELQLKNEEVIIKNNEIEKQQLSISEKNEKLDAKNKTLLQLDEEKNHLISVVAHDLRSPLNNIIGLVGVINHEPENLTNEQIDFMEKINQSAEKLNDMISKVLNKDNLESGSLEMKMEMTDINKVIRNSISGLEQKASNKQILIHFNQTSDLPEIHIDKNFADQVFTNLISNAINFSPNRLNIYIKAIQVEGAIEIHIQDEGPGISKDDLPKLFGRYQRLSARPTAGEASTGLGLSIVKQYVEAMNGSVRCVSEVGNGANFIVSFNLS